MKILYAIQGTGNGHISRSVDIAPALEAHGDVDYMISGAQWDLELPYEVKYRSKGLSFYFGRSGGINIPKTIAANSSKRFVHEIKDLPIEKYDLIVNDFEPVSAWAAKLKNKKVVALSHQSALLSEKCPKPASADVIGKSILKRYAPAKSHYGFHFDAFDENIYTPIIRKEIRDREVTDCGHYVVYLPAYADEKIINVLSRIKGVFWKVYSKHSKQASKHKNIAIEPIANSRFVAALTSARGVLCGAGFETPSEALFLGKKLMVIPMRGQYEQQCNATALKKAGIPVLKKLGVKRVEKIRRWVESGTPKKIDYPNETQKIVDHIIKKEVEK